MWRLKNASPFSPCLKAREFWGLTGLIAPSTSGGDSLALSEVKRAWSNPDGGWSGYEVTQGRAVFSVLT